MADWKLIETAPKDGRWILTARVGHTPLMARWLDGSREWQPIDRGGGDFNFHPTHWMLLPDPPSSDSVHLETCDD